MAETQRTRYLSFLVLLVLIVVAVVYAYQTVPILGSYSWGILNSLDHTAIWRGAKFSNSNNFADFINFLNQVIPQGATVILPPERGGIWTLSDTPSMQYFLHFRDIINCSTTDCSQNYLGRENTYLIINGFDRLPGYPDQINPDNFQMYNDTWGVYGPELKDLDSASSMVSALGNFWTGFVLPFLWFGNLIISGFLLGILWFPAESSLMQLAIGPGLLLGGQSLVSYLSLLIWPHSSLGIPVFIYYGISLLGLVFEISRRKGVMTGIAPLFSGIKNVDIWLLGILGLIAINTFVAIGSGYHYGDGIVLWVTKGLGISREGLSGVTTWGTNTTQYPLHIPLLIAFLESTFGHLLPVSKVISPLYYGGLLLLVYGYTARRRNRLLAFLGVIGLALMPLVSLHGRIGYANLPLTYYLVAAVLILSELVENPEIKNRSKSMLGAGVCLLLGIWTRPEGPWMVFPLIGIYLVTWMRLTTDLKKTTSFLLYILLPAAVWFGFWLISKQSFYADIVSKNSALGLALRQIRRGNFQLGDLWFLIQFLGRQLFSYQSWFMIGSGLLLSVILWLTVRLRNSLAWHMIWVSGLVVVLVVSAMYYTLAFDTRHDMSWWLTSGFNRQLMPGMTLIWIAILDLFQHDSAVK